MRGDGEGWQQLILVDNRKGLQALDRLAKSDRPKFEAITHELLNAAAVPVRQAALRLLYTFGREGDAEAEEGALAALAVPELREWAAHALGKVGSPAAFSELIRYAQARSAGALRAAAKKAQTPEQRSAVVDIAKSFVLADAFPLRQSALWIVLPTLSTQEGEDLLLEVARRYLDEDALGSLRYATLRVVPALKELLDETVQGTAEYDDVLRTIQVIESRNLPAGGADP